MSNRSMSESAIPLAPSRVPGRPSFRHSAVNAVAVVPLLSTNQSSGHENPNSHSTKSLQGLFDALARHNKQEQHKLGKDLLLVVPNSNLTRPGDWRYDQSPLKNFHWEHGCQRMHYFDGRPDRSRMAHDRLMNHGVSREWIDICPHRRTAAVIGVLNIRDCPDLETLKRAEEEWQQWADRYSTPPYEVTAHGRNFERDTVIQRLFVFDSAHESNKIDLEQTSLAKAVGSSLVAFPPTDKDQLAMLDLHMNVVVNDLAVAIFQRLEEKIRESDAVTGSHGQPLTPAAATKRFFSKAASGLSGKDGSSENDNSGPQTPSKTSLTAIASLVSPDNRLAVVSPAAKKNTPVSQLQQAIPSEVSKGTSTEAQLLTPLDDVWDLSELSPKDAQGFMRREVGRREKFAGDMALLAGSPIDAYERYTKAAELCKNNTPDPLWYASALEGCAAAHISMAEIGGFSVDEYLENSFQLPDEILSCAIQSVGDNKSRQNPIGKQSLPSVVSALCEEALGILNRHPKLAPLAAELLLKLAWYCAEIEDTHVRCQWGLGKGCYEGDTGTEKPLRWQHSTMARMNFLDLTTKNGDDVIAVNTFQRCQKFTSLMHRAISSGALDAVSRTDVALCCATMCLKGLRPTEYPSKAGRSETRLQFKRKAALFATAAAEAISEATGGEHDSRVGPLWQKVNQLYSRKANSFVDPSYGWATIRATTLHALTLQNNHGYSENSAVSLLSLLSEIHPNPKSSGTKVGSFLGKLKSLPDQDNSSNYGGPNRAEEFDDNVSYTAESVVIAARTYVRTQAQDAIQNARNRGVNFFNQSSKDPSSLLVAAQSRWVDDKPVKFMLFPLADNSDISYSIVALKSVWPSVKYDNCVIAQQKLISQIMSLRKELPASSAGETKVDSDVVKQSPISVVSVSIVDSKSRAKLERMKIKKKKTGTEKDDGMSTFFNPYANTAKNKEESNIILVAEGEERYVNIRFCNRLSVPMDIPRSQLIFSGNHADRVKAPAMSFVVPGQADDFSIQFPFIILPRPSSNENAEAEDVSNIVDIKGISITFMGRTIELSFGSPEPHTESPQNIPRSASLFPRRKFDEPNSGDKNGFTAPQLDVVPPQPSLIASFELSPTPIDGDTVIPVPISDGEIFVLPSISLRNDNKSRADGFIETLLVTAHDVPAYGTLPLLQLGSDGTTELLAEKNKKAKSDACPLKLSIETDNMSLESLNGANKSSVCSMSIRIQAAANLGAYTSGCTVRLRFRYKAKTYNQGFEVWRRYEMKLRIVRIKGPRISSITFRPDLSWSSGYTLMCKVLARTFARGSEEELAPEGMQGNGDGNGDEPVGTANGLTVKYGVQVGGNEVIVLLSVANETNFTIALSRADGAFGFQNSQMETLRISPGVSSKVPIIIPRFKRDENICSRLVSIAALQWKSEVVDGAADDEKLCTSGTVVASNKRVRHGNIEIPFNCLKAVLDENPSALNRLCEPPCNLEVSLETTGEGEVLNTDIGKPVKIIATVAQLSPSTSGSKNVKLRFCCSKRGTATSSMDQDQFVWCGKTQKILTSIDKDEKHSASVIFLAAGQYIVSACVDFGNDDDPKSREVWWSPKALNVEVTEKLIETEASSTILLSQTNHSQSSTNGGGGWFTLDG